MRTQPDKTEGFGIGQLIDQDEIGPDVAITGVLPFSGQRVVAVTGFQWLIVRQGDQNGHQISIERHPVFSPLASRL
jgi:hypothetical protein